REAAKQRVFGGNLLVVADHSVVLGNGPPPPGLQQAQSVAKIIFRVRKWNQIQERLHVRIHCHGRGRIPKDGAQPGTGFQRGNRRTARQPEYLPDALVRTHEEGAVLDHRPSDAASKMIFSEGGNRLIAGVKEILRVKLGIAEEFKSAAMYLVGSRSRNRVHDATDAATVLRSVVGLQNG